MNAQAVVAWVFAVAGSTIIGLHFGSGLLGIGAYCCIVAAGNWKP